MKREKFIHLRVSSTERKELERLARSEGRTKSGMLRELVRKAARGIDYTPLARKETP